MVIVLAALIALIGSQILDWLKAKRSKADLLRSKLEEVSERIETFFFDEIKRFNEEIVGMINNGLPDGYPKDGLREVNPKFHCRISSIIRIYFDDTQLEVFFDELFQLYVNLGNIQTEVLKRLITSQLKPLKNKEKAEVESMLAANEKKCLPCWLNLMGVGSSLGNKLVMENSITFWAFSWKLGERVCRFYK